MCLALSPVPDQTHPSHQSMTQYSADEIAEASLEHTVTDDEPTFVCAVCGSEIDRHDWHPVATRTNGSVELFLFCEDSCRETWVDSEEDPA
ncbi:DUF7576 family protein [Haloarchaeobius amylolyticus]|uniref:DUF7576 family protein n=1 Tax=Haloarchaeobius amylolyticus TaxID=1198296 RepID=UPI00226F20D5|nr:hypothetical protein [Haloarchaeobius amylolyticus]